MSQYSKLRNYGKQILDINKEIKNIRLYEKIDNEESINADVNVEEILQNIFSKVRTSRGIDLSKFRYKISYRKNGTGFYMKWHIDDAVVNSRKISTDENDNELIKRDEEDRDIDENGEIIREIMRGKDKISLYYPSGEKGPKYSLVIYLSSYGKDFLGGKFRFADDTEIIPEKGHFLFFDSREVHRIDIINRGSRENYIVKFYSDSDSDLDQI